MYNLEFVNKPPFLQRGKNFIWGPVGFPTQMKKDEIIFSFSLLFASDFSLLLNRPIIYHINTSPRKQK